MKAGRLLDWDDEFVGGLAQKLGGAICSSPNAASISATCESWVTTLACSSDGNSLGDDWTGGE